MTLEERVPPSRTQKQYLNSSVLMHNMTYLFLSVQYSAVAPTKKADSHKNSGNPGNSKSIVTAVTRLTAGM